MSASDTTIGATTTDLVEGTSLWADAYKRLKKNRMAVVCGIFVVLLIVACFIGPVIIKATWGYDFEAQDLEYGAQAPSWSHWFGTDFFGRDLLTRVLFGGQISLIVGLLAASVAALIGTVYGAVAGYAGGRVDNLMMRIVDIIYTLPYMFLVIILVSVAGQSLLLLFLALGFVAWLTTARIVRGQVLSIKEREYVQAARSLGATGPAIIKRHLIPNTLGPIVVYFSLTVPTMIRQEAFLSFLGLGVQAPRPSLGALINEGAQQMTVYWWALVFPGGVMALLLFSLNFLGDGLRDALDPPNEELKMAEPILSVRDLRTYFKTDDGIVKAVDGVSFDLEPGECLGIVGESGSGKSVTNLAVMGLIPQPPGFFPSGEVHFEGNNLMRLKEKELLEIRGNRVSMIFQDPMTSLNPYLTVERQLTEVLERHKGVNRSKARVRAIEMLERVGIPEPAGRVDSYPHQFSGGMRQRVMIAMALLCEPALLIADEPTTALDVTIQAQILALIGDLRRDFGTSVILITHDLGVVAGMADRIAVMYAGRIVETGKTEPLFDSPQHPYTRGLLASVPRLDEATREELVPIPGLPPDLSALPAGCPFHPRCELRHARCEESYPDRVELDASRWASCWEVPHNSGAQPGREGSA